MFDNDNFDSSTMGSIGRQFASIPSITTTPSSFGSVVETQHNPVGFDRHTRIFADGSTESRTGFHNPW